LGYWMKVEMTDVRKKIREKGPMRLDAAVRSSCCMLNEKLSDYNHRGRTGV